jgi:hypothetical protein
VSLVRSFALKLFRLIKVHGTAGPARDREREALIRKTNKSSVLRTLDVCDIGFFVASGGLASGEKIDVHRDQDEKRSIRRIRFCRMK